MSNTTAIEIYNGLTFIGHVTERDKGRRCEAFSVTGEALGVFPSPAKAATAVYEAAHGQQDVMA